MSSRESPAPQSLKVSHGLESAKRWAGQLDDERRQALIDLVDLYQSGGPAAIMRRRAVVIGTILNDLERAIGNNPASLATLGALYRQLVESERRAWKETGDLEEVGAANTIDLAG